MSSPPRATASSVRRRLNGGWDRDELKRGRELGRIVSAHVQIRAAVVGVRGVMAALIRGTSAIGSGFTLVPCPTEEKARAYLMRD